MNSYYKPGDLPPTGYLQWHEWADVQRKAGIKQRQCDKCGLWITPQERPAHMAEHDTNAIAAQAFE